jgi:hypothetical protein
MTDYRFTSPFPTVFSDLQHGVNATVTPADPDADPPLEGSTVVLSEGDTLHVDEPLEHIHLTDLNADAPKPARNRRTPNRPAPASSPAGDSAPPAEKE